MAEVLQIHFQFQVLYVLFMCRHIAQTHTADLSIFVVE
jgi:hypothetical protein